MRRGDRLFELIEILRTARQPLSGQTIADQLEVSKRTVYRDIAALMAQRVPIRGEAGIGYILESGFHMPPLMLTSDEIEAAILGAQWVGTRGDPELAMAANSLIAKVQAIASDDVIMMFEDPATSVAPLPPVVEGLDAATIRQAIHERQKIQIRYKKGSETESETDRIIWPVLVGYRDGSRIVAAWCELRRDFRYFRTDKIVVARLLDASIPKSRRALRQEWQAAMDKERARYQALSP